MAIRVNTLGKGALVNRELNSAYDIVEYVADNLELLTDISSKIQSIKIFRDIIDLVNHIDNDEIHLSQEQIEAINQIELIRTALNNTGVDLTSVSNQLQSIIANLNNHIQDTVVHVTQEDKDKWNNYQTAISDLSVALDEVSSRSISYNSLTDKPEIPEIVVDSEVNANSTNLVENRAIATELTKYPLKTAISSVGFTGSYSDLEGVPDGDNALDNFSNNWVKNKIVTKAINNLADDIQTLGRNLDTRPLTNAEIDQLMNS